MCFKHEKYTKQKVQQRGAAHLQKSKSTGTPDVTTPAGRQDSTPDQKQFTDKMKIFEVSGKFPTKQKFY